MPGSSTAARSSRVPAAGGAQRPAVRWRTAKQLELRKRKVGEKEASEAAESPSSPKTSAQQCIAPGANRPTVLHLTNGRRSRKDCQGVQGAGGASGAPSPGADPLPGLAGCMTE
ncbi:uncharacterized protein LOC142364117 isoform X2 [Opisthocomus hoazin]|uniref:uncharacterized protein LOC142364117 isoform X2 n=1 Tax=Opisthocomus hoazin TaxID=30419 RepID=UPI003F52A687